MIQIKEGKNKMTISKATFSGNFNTQTAIAAKKQNSPNISIDSEGTLSAQFDKNKKIQILSPEKKDSLIIKYLVGGFTAGGFIYGLLSSKEKIQNNSKNMIQFWGQSLKGKLGTKPFLNLGKITLFSLAEGLILGLASIGAEKLITKNNYTKSYEHLKNMASNLNNNQ